MISGRVLEIDCTGMASQTPEQADSKLTIGVDLVTLDDILILRVEMSSVSGKRRYVLATENC